jgi:AcrR family transcriptional regulator
MFHGGLDHSTVSQITEIADVGKGTFFNYFPTKGHVVTEFVNARTRSLTDLITEVRAGRIAAEAALVAFVTDKLWPPDSDGWLGYYRSIISAMAEDDLVRASVAERMIGQRHAYELLIHEGQVRAEFRTDFSAADLATYVHRFIVGFALSSWTDNRGPRIAAEDPLMRIILSVLKGPRGIPARTPKSQKDAGRSRTPWRTAANRARRP